jgi:hypothetical protein
MTKKSMLLAAGALTALAFAALPAGASAEEMLEHCSAAPCEGVVQSTGSAVLTDDGGARVECAKATGSTPQIAATASTAEVVLTFDECNNDCNNEGAGTRKIITNVMTGHLITFTKGNPATAGVLLTGVNVTFKCAFGLVTKTVTGNIIGTITNPECGKAVTHHTIVFSQTGFGQQTDMTYTGSTFDLLTNNTTSALTGEGHVNYAGGKTVTLTC